MEDPCHKGFHKTGTPNFLNRSDTANMVAEIRIVSLRPSLLRRGLLFFRILGLSFEVVRLVEVFWVFGSVKHREELTLLRAN